MYELRRASSVKDLIRRPVNKIGISDRRWKSSTRHVFIYLELDERGRIYIYIAKYRLSTYTMNLEELEKEVHLRNDGYF